MTIQPSNAELLTALSKPASELRLPASLPVTYKGVGRSSGDAPRAVKTILLNRLLVEYGRDAVAHIAGDTYRVGGRSFTFRVTTSPRRTSLPWFNVSAREVGGWQQNDTAVIVAGAYPLNAENTFAGIVVLLEPELFGDLRAMQTKASEKHPTSLFEMSLDASSGLKLANSSAHAEVPPVVVPVNAWGNLNLSPEESAFLAQAYSVKREPDPTSGGRFKPLTLLVDPGEGSNEEVAELLAEISKLYRMVGGSGITFKLTDVRRPVEVSV